MAKHQKHGTAAEPADSRADQQATIDKPDTPKADSGWLTLGEGVFIGLLTSFAYLSAYGYERGFLGVFGIPHQLVSVNTLTIVVALLGLYLFASIIGNLAFIITRATSQFPRIAACCTVGLIVMALAAAVLGPILGRGTVFTVLPALVIISLFMLVGTTWSRIEVLASHLFVQRLHRNPLVWSIVLLGYFMTFLLACELGRFFAWTEARGMLVIRQTATTRTATEPAVTTGLLVVRQYDGRWLCAEMQLESQQLTRKFRVIDPTTLTQPAERMKLDHLKLPDSK